MPPPFKIALAGLGTVGGKTADILLHQAKLLQARCGRKLQIVACSDLNQTLQTDHHLSDIPWFEDALSMMAQTDADVVVELIGGSEGIAKQVCETALARGCHVVTANKALLAHHGVALARLAEEKDVCLAFEAAIAGGIPIVRSLRDGLVANRFSRLVGILNGTCNYILTSMAQSGQSFEHILRESQALGYAEAEPSFDVDGIDTAHKIALLTAIAFGHQVDFNSVHIEGIREITPIDITHAKELGFQIKLLGITTQRDGQIEQRVHPCLVPQNSDIAHVTGVDNGIRVDGDFIGTTFYQGPGAGGEATGSAVVSDLVSLARGQMSHAFCLPTRELDSLTPTPISDHYGAAYLRFTVKDEPGVMARIAQCLSEHHISVETLLQHGQDQHSQGQTKETGFIPIIIVTHQCLEIDLQNALRGISKIPEITCPPLMIRIESFP